MAGKSIAVIDQIEKSKQEIGKALPQSIPTEKFVRTVRTAIQLNPDIQNAEPRSVLAACMKAAADGLVLDGREAALVTFKSNGQKQAQYMPMVSGIIKKVRNSGEISVLNAFLVHENDHFDVRLGLDLSLEHRPNWQDPGQMIGAYAAVRYKDGGVDFEFMPKNEIERIRGRSRSKDNGPWKTDYGEMARKTVLRRLSKRLPMSTDIANVVGRVDEHYDLDAEAEPAPEPPRQKKQGAAASALNDEPATDVDPDTGEVQDAEEVPAGQGETEPATESTDEDPI